MRAITEIPAKTPRPIGRTDNFFPGRLKFVSDASAAAAVPLASVEVADAELAVGVDWVVAAAGGG